MHDHIKKHINALINLNDEEMTIFLSKLEIKTYKRKHLILKEGDVCSHSYFVNKGCLRYFYNIDGHENTGQFFFENSWYTDYESYLTKKPSRQNIEVLEKAEVVLLAKADLESLFQKVPKFEKFGRLMAEGAFLGLRNRTEMLTNLSPEERYVLLMKERPKVLERVPQHYIASYLGIKGPSLSRIRKRILDNR